MVRRPYGPADTSAQAVTRRLHATGSSDPDVLYAARQELAAPYARHRVIALLVIVGAAFTCLTVMLVPLGVPLIVVGIRHRRRCTANLATIYTAHAQYVAALEWENANIAAMRRRSPSSIPEREQPSSGAAAERRIERLPHDGPDSRQFL